MTNKELKQNNFLERYVDAIYPSKEEFGKILNSEEQLTVYCGIDPTADFVHLGHAINYLILKKFQEMGHKVIVLVGDFTAMIGDPTDKGAARTRLTKEEVSQNMKSYKKQISKIISLDDKKNPVEFRFNSEWLSKLNFEEITDLASNFTVQNMIERETFRKRISEEKPLYVHEFLYPLMQGYDSVAMEVDVEVGGSDQLFNMLAGRTLVKRYLEKEKFVVTHPLLENPKTGEILMSKSKGTGIALNDSPEDMYGKVMALPDEAIAICFRYCTEVPMDEIERKEELAESDPKSSKMDLAREIVSMYHSKEDAEKAEKSWKKTFEDGGVPDDVLEIKVGEGQMLSDVVVGEKILPSKSQFSRLLKEGAIKHVSDGEEVVDDPKREIKKGEVYKIGKKNFIKGV